MVSFDCNIDFDAVFIFSNDCLALLSITRYRKNSNVFFLLDIVGAFETEFPIAMLGSTVSHSQLHHSRALVQGGQRICVTVC